MMKNYFFVCVWCTSLAKFVLSQPEVNCSLTVSNKIEFEDEILEYLDEDSKTVLLQYNLDFSGIGHDFDLSNRTNPSAYQPWKWYRAHIIGVERLLLFNTNYVFDVLMSFLTKSVNVKVLATPAGCLNNINREDMEPFIIKFLLDDFGINVDDLRTSRRLNENAKICTAHITTTDNETGTLNYRCCEYGLHKDVVCSSLSFDWTLLATLIIMNLFALLVYLYSPMLFSEFVQPSKQIFYQKGEVYMKNLCTELDKLEYKNYTAKVKEIHLNEGTFIQRNQRTCNGILSVIQFFFSGSNDSIQMAVTSKWRKMFDLRKFIFFLIHIVPSSFFCHFVFNDSFVKALDKELVDRGLSTASEKHFVNKFLKSIAVISILFQVGVFLMILTYDVVIYDKFGKAVASVHNLWKQKTLKVFDCFRNLYSKSRLCLLGFIILSPLGIIILYVINPFQLIVLSVRPKVRIIRRVLNFYFALIVSLTISLPSVVMAQVVIYIIALLMFKAAVILPFCSGLVALLINLRFFSRVIGKKHDKCLRNLAFLVHQKQTASPSSNNYFSENTGPQEIVSEDQPLMTSTLRFSKIIQPLKSIVSQSNCLYLKIEKSPAYILKNEIISINKDAIFHCMRFLYVKAFFGFFAIIFFLSAVILVVVIIGRFDYINSSNQVFITFVTGVIPTILSLGKDEKQECSTADALDDLFNNIHREELEEIKSKLESYIEKHFITDIIIEDPVETTDETDFDFIMLTENPRQQENPQQGNAINNSQNELNSLLVHNSDESVHTFNTFENSV